MRAYNWLDLKLCIFLLMHFLTVEARLTVTPVSNACPGEDMTFTCQKSSNDGTTLSNVRWTLTRDSTEVIPQLALTQGSGCPNLYRHYNNLPIVVTLYNSYSTLNITADGQLHGITVECLLVSSTVERANVLIQITQPPSFPSNAHITSIHNGSYSATVELAWDFSRVNNNTFFTISISLNGGGTWFSRAIMEDQNVSITLSYNTDYTLDVMAENCAGHCEVSSTLDIFIANCSAPIIPSAGVVVEPYNNTVEGAVIYFNCDNGFIPNQRRMAVCQSNGQWSPKISNLTCKQGNKDHTFQTLLMKEEFLFQCEKDSGTFLVVCKGEAATLNCSSCDNHGGESDFVYGRVEGLAGFTVASFVLGMICGAMFLLLPCLIKKRYKAINKKKMELSQNMAYEAIPFPSKLAFQEKAMIK